MKKHVLVGMAGAILLLLVYTGIITLAEGWDHALDQTARLWYLVIPLAGGFGIQAGLFSFIRQAIRERRAATTASVVTTGGISAGSMAACCAHHLTDVLPLLGLSGLAAFLANYQVVFIVGGILSNIVGIAVMLEAIQCQGLSNRLAGWGWNMGRVKKGTMISAGLIFLVAFVVNFFTPLAT